ARPKSPEPADETPDPEATEPMAAEVDRETDAELDAVPEEGALAGAAARLGASAAAAAEAGRGGGGLGAIGAGLMGAAVLGAAIVFLLTTVKRPVEVADADPPP